MQIDVRAFQLSDYDEVLALWRECEGVGLNESDSREAVEAFLARNPGMSAVARRADGGLVGAVLCGDDGRRGYLHHLAVAPALRRQGIAARLVGHALAALRARRIQKCNIFLFADNAGGQAFWLHTGWAPRADLRVLQKPVLDAR